MGGGRDAVYIFYDLSGLVYGLFLQKDHEGERAAHISGLCGRRYDSGLSLEPAYSGYEEAEANGGIGWIPGGRRLYSGRCFYYGAGRDYPSSAP